MVRVAIIGAGSVGSALGGGMSRLDGVEVVYGVRDPSDPRHGTLAAVADVAGMPEACAGAAVVVLALPATAVAQVVPGLGLADGQVVVDTTNAVRTPVPDGHATMGDHVASLLPGGVSLVKAFDTIGAEHLSDGHLGPGIDGADRAFLPIAGDEPAVAAVVPLAEGLGFDVAVLGGREAFGIVEDHARLWIHLAFACGWGRGFGFVVRER